MLEEDHCHPPQEGPTHTSDAPQLVGEDICPLCRAQKGGRKLVVALDGTMNQFGLKNSNVVEIYARIKKDSEQLTYYNSGIGTYANPSRAKWWKLLYKRIDSWVDLAIAWNFERTILAAYRWLSEQYKPGDQIFLFGFSRGAYQVRVLAAMIDEVGLIYAGNEEQIPFAYEVYINAGSVEEAQKAPEERTTERFKKTFSRSNVRVHFTGVWDTVSSVGIFRSKNFPKTETADHMCHFRHALALDERRVKFSPEDLFRKHRSQTSSVVTNEEPHFDEKRFGVRVKEVWFAGCHSDVGGGNKRNEKLLMDEIPALWMVNEARMLGLKFVPSKVEWDWSKLQHQKPMESLNVAWWLLEIVPFLSRSDDFPGRPYRWIVPHLGANRFIHPGQKIHLSVALKRDYRPKAQFVPESIGLRTWSDILGKALDIHLSFEMPHLNDILEMDLFDTSTATELVGRLRSAIELPDVLDRLSNLALYAGSGTKAILAADHDIPDVLSSMLGSKDLEAAVRSKVLELVKRMATDGIGAEAFWKSRMISVLLNLVSDQQHDLPIKSGAELQAFLQLYQPTWVKILYTYDPRTVDILVRSLSTDWAGPAVSALITLVDKCEFPIKEALTEVATFLEKRGVPTAIRSSAARQIPDLVQLASLNVELLYPIIQRLIDALKDMLKLRLTDVLSSVILRIPEYVDQRKEPHEAAREGHGGESRLSRPYLRHFTSSRRRIPIGQHADDLIFSNADGITPTQLVETLILHADNWDRHDDELIFLRHEGPDEELSSQNNHGLIPGSSLGHSIDLGSEWRDSVARHGKSSFVKDFLIWFDKTLHWELRDAKSSTLFSLTSIARSRDLGDIAHTAIEASTADSILEVYSRSDIGETISDAAKVMFHVSDLPDTTASTFFKEGFVDLLYTILKSNEADAQMTALGALSELLRHDPIHSRVKSTEFDFMGILKRLVKSTELRYKGVLQKLPSLTYNRDDLYQSMLKHRVLQIVGQLMRSSDRNTREEAIIAVIGLLAQKADRCETVVQMGLIHAISGVLGSAEPDRVVKSLADSSVLHNDAFRNALVKSKCVQKLAKLTVNYSNTTYAREDAINCLKYFGRHDEALTEIADILYDLMELLGGVEELLREAASDAFCEFVASSKLREIMLRQRFITFFREKLLKPDQSALHIARVLRSLVKYDDAVTVLRKQNFIEVLETFVEDATEEVTENVAVTEDVEEIYSLLYEVPNTPVDGVSGVPAV